MHHLKVGGRIIHHKYKLFFSIGGHFACSQFVPYSFAISSNFRCAPSKSKLLMAALRADSRGLSQALARAPSRVRKASAASPSLDSRRALRRVIAVVAARASKFGLLSTPAGRLGMTSR